MKNVLGATALAVLLAMAPVLANGVVKVNFTTEDGIVITGSSKTTGNGSQFTVCGFEDAETGAFLGQIEEPGVGFDTEVELQAHCASLAPQ